jgi:hypothetical protein
MLPSCRDDVPAANNRPYRSEISHSNDDRCLIFAVPFATCIIWGADRLLLSFQCLRHGQNLHRLVTDIRGYVLDSRVASRLDDLEQTRRELSGQPAC